MRSDAALELAPTRRHAAGPGTRDAAHQSPREHACAARGVAREPGEPLDSRTRSRLEPLFGADFSDVRLHHDAASASAARSLGAAAYTVGQHVHFGAGRYQPEGAEGGRLLAHELAHTLQQRDATEPGAAIEVRAPDDTHEREAHVAADRVASGLPAPSMSSAGTQAVQRSTLGAIFGAIGSALAAPFVAIYRLFGGEFYFADTLKEYLKKIRAANAIEDNYDSDNKARACVSREAELGPYDTATKVLLIREMLNGATLWADEASIIALLRGAAPAERQQIVTAIGRDRILDDFSFGNLRTVEAMMLTAADARSAGFKSRFRSMSDSHFEDYLANALDQDVRTALMEIRNLKEAQKRTSTPIPADASITQGQVAVQIRGIDVIFLPDGQDPAAGSDAYTRAGLRSNGVAAPELQGDPPLVSNFEAPRLRVEIQTFYGPDAKPGGPARYGRGTRPEDKAAGKSKTSLGSHEGAHGSDAIEYVKNHDIPVFHGQNGMTGPEFTAATDAFIAEIDRYNDDMLRNTVRLGDCAGNVRIRADSLQRQHLPAVFCDTP